MLFLHGWSFVPRQIFRPNEIFPIVSSKTFFSFFGCHIFGDVCGVELDRGVFFLRLLCRCAYPPEYLGNRDLRMLFGQVIDGRLLLVFVLPVHGSVAFMVEITTAVAGAFSCQKR